MIEYSVYDLVTKESKSFFTVSEAKKHMKALLAQGHECQGTKTKIYANGDFEPAGEITLKGSNKTFMANTRQTKPGY